MNKLLQTLANSLGIKPWEVVAISTLSFLVGALVETLWIEGLLR